MKVYLVQMEVLPGKPEENVKKMKAAVARAKKAGAEVVLFPEFSVSGDFSRLGSKQDEIGFQIRCRDAEVELEKVSKGIEILAGTSAMLEEFMYNHEPY